MQAWAQGNTLAGLAAIERTPSKRAVRAGRVLSGIAAAFLIFDSIGKLLEVQPVLEGTRQLGYPTDVVFSLGVILIVSVLLYLIPRTSLLGGVLLTGYLGGAVATHVRVGNPMLTHTLFPIYVGALVWGGLLLRDARLRVLLPWHRAR